MMLRKFSMLLLAAALMACAPAGAPGSRDSSAQTDARVPKRITFAVGGEPGPLVTQMFGGTGGAEWSLRGAVHQKLVVYDDRSQVYPQLAVELPARDKGTWLVRPDGTMQTTYKLQNATWHDGAPLQAKDFAFAWTVTRDRDIQMARRFVADQISGAETPDSQTLVLEWRTTYPFANAIIEEDLGPIPSHLLFDIYQTDKARFQDQPYWTREFIGLGPFRLSEWEPGSHLLLNAYDGYFGGRPKIDSILYKIIVDENARWAQFLAGALDAGSASSVQETLKIKEEQERDGKHPFLRSQITKWHLASVQFRNPTPREILDPRLRRALVHALDRQALADVDYAGQAPIANAFIPTIDVRYGWISDIAATYPQYDPRKAQEILDGMGWRKGGDGMYANAAGERMTIPIWTTTDVQEIAIIADYWKRIGLNVDQTVLGRAQQQDLAVRATFPAVETTSIGLNFDQLLGKSYGANCPVDATRWAGSNRGCYQNPELDRISDQLAAALEPSDQQRLYRTMATIYTEELPQLQLYFTVSSTLYRESIVGIKGESRPGENLMWNVLEWDLK